MSGLLLGIDVGTYSSKGVLVEADGNVVKTALVEHDRSIPHPGLLGEARCQDSAQPRQEAHLRLAVCRLPFALRVDK